MENGNFNPGNPEQAQNENAAVEPIESDKNAVVEPIESDKNAVVEPIESDKNAVDGPGESDKNYALGPDQNQLFGQKSIEAANSYVNADKSGILQMNPRETSDSYDQRKVADEVNKRLSESESFKRSKKNAEQMREQIDAYQSSDDINPGDRDHLISQTQEQLDEAKRNINEMVEKTTDDVERERREKDLNDFESTLESEQNETDKKLENVFNTKLEEKETTIRAHENVILSLEIGPDDGPEVVEAKLEAIELADKNIERIRDEAKIAAIREYRLTQRINNANEIVRKIKERREKANSEQSQQEALPTNVIE